MISSSPSGRQLRATSLIALFFAGSIHCAHGGGESPQEGGAAEASVVDPRGQEESLESSSQGATGPDAGEPESTASSSMESERDPLHGQAGCIHGEALAARAIDLRLNLSFTETPESISALFSEAGDPADLGARFRTELQPLVEGCLSPADVEPLEHQLEGSAPILRISGDDERFTMAASMETPCLIGGVSNVGGEFRLEISTDDDGEISVSMAAGDLIVDGHFLGNVSIALRPPDEQGTFLVEVHISMDRLPPGWGRGIEQTIERSLSPLVDHLEAATKAFHGLFDSLLTILAHALVDLMRAQGHHPH